MRDPQPRPQNGLDPQPDDRWRLLAERARVEGRRVWLALLDDRLLWNESPAWAQDQAILAAAEQLGSAYQFVSSDIYECGGQSHRIASFRYLGANPQTSSFSLRNPLDWVFRLVPGGTFLMGSLFSDTPSDDREQPAHSVSISPLLVAATLTTQAMWLDLDSQNPSFFAGGSRPVDRVSWDLSRALAQRAGSGLRLPSEAEWEYICRAGTQSRYCFGDDPAELDKFAWYSKGPSEGTGAVAQLAANAFGLYDVHGNLWEWCEDPWHGDYQGAS